MGGGVQPVDATLLAEALRRGAEAIPPLRIKILYTALVPRAPGRRVCHLLAALSALPELSLLLPREPCPCMSLHMHRHFLPHSPSSPPASARWVCLVGAGSERRKRSPEQTLQGDVHRNGPDVLRLATGRSIRPPGNSGTPAARGAVRACGRALKPRIFRQGIARGFGAINAKFPNEYCGGTRTLWPLALM